MTKIKADPSVLNAMNEAVEAIRRRLVCLISYSEQHEDELPAGAPDSLKKADKALQAASDAFLKAYCKRA